MSRRRIERRSPTVTDRLPQAWHPVLRRVYCHRGVGELTDADLGLARLLPFTGLKGIDRAADLLMEALRQQWHVCVVGDYDADGATSTALMVTVLRKFGMKKVSYRVPDRFRYGYGLSPEIVKQALDCKPDLLVTVDNGIASVEGVAAARSAGLRVLITDHHLPGRRLPDADAIVNPNQAGCAFASKSLAGVGVAFYLLLALRARLREQGEDNGLNMASCLDLVALGTVADMVPLDHNNRILVEHGLRQLRAGRGAAGIHALLQLAGRASDRLRASDLGFAVAPRLNAAGRLDDMSIGVECLLAEDEAVALEIASRLDQLNRERREIQQQMQDEAQLALEKQLSRTELPVGVCVFDPAWHQGITGLVAGRIKDRYHRPAIAFAPADAQGSLLRGSARSVRGFHIRDALDAIAGRHPGLITKFGGHAMAAGLSLERTKLQEFSAAFDAEARRCLDGGALEAIVESDGELSSEDLALPLAESLDAGGPWGQGFPEPVFDGRFEVLDQRIVGERHLKLRLRPEAGRQTCSAIAFNRTDGAEAGRYIHAAYRLGINDYAGRRVPELAIEYLEKTT